MPRITVPASARIPRQALLAVRRHRALRSPLGVAARSARVRRRARLVDSFSLRVQLLYAYIWLLAIEATTERSARIPECVLCQRLGPVHNHVGCPICMWLSRARHHDAVTCITMELRAAN